MRYLHTIAILAAVAALGVGAGVGVARAQPGGSLPGQEPGSAGKPARADGKPASLAGDDTARSTPGQTRSGERSTVLHIPPIQALARSELRLIAVVDAAWSEQALVARYRSAGSESEYTRTLFERSSAGGYYATVPADRVTRPGLEYYIVGELADGRESLHFASRDAPHRVIVAPPPDVRWQERERRRLHGKVSSVSVDVTGHDFNNRYGNPDYFVRGELEWAHRLLGRLYAISLGYGFIEGRTPDGTDASAESVVRGGRFGWGGVRLKGAESVWLDARAYLGVSREGFITGVRGALILGRPWRAHVELGGEMLQELGPSVWIRLQWDTVPPFLMGAKVVKTDLPAATLANGSYIAYDVSYPLGERITVRGSVSFGNRDGPAFFGGGLGTAFAF